MLPAAFALAAQHRDGVRLIAKAEWLPLLDDARIETFAIERREMAELFSDKSDLSDESDQVRRLFSDVRVVHSWTGATDAVFRRRLAMVTAARAQVHPFRGM